MFRFVSKSAGFRSFSLSRFWNRSEGEKGATNEKKIKDILQEHFPAAKAIEVMDISGGCGAMFEIMVEAPEFRGLTTVKQHRLINEALKEEIKDMHGLRINTCVPP